MENDSAKQRIVVITAWVFLILASGLPRIVIQELFHYPIVNNLSFGIAAIVILSGLSLTFIWETVAPLRSFFSLFLVLVGIEWLVFTKLALLPAYASRLADPSFNVFMLANQSLRSIVSLVIIVVLYILRKSPAAFFLVRGTTDAPAEPVSWLGIKDGERWNTLGRNSAVIISLGTLTFLIVAGHPPLNIVVRALPFLPAVLLAAVFNAFNEEITYKASFLSVLEEVVGRDQALLLMAAYFGIGHFYGIPYGIIGVLMAGFLGWFLGKSMLETRGFWWAWFIHFWQDVLIFAFLAIGSITPGGG